MNIEIYTRKGVPENKYFAFPLSNDHMMVSELGTQKGARMSTTEFKSNFELLTVENINVTPVIKPGSVYRRKGWKTYLYELKSLDDEYVNFISNANGPFRVTLKEFVSGFELAGDKLSTVIKPGNVYRHKTFTDKKYDVTPVGKDHVIVINQENQKVARMSIQDFMVSFELIDDKKGDDTLDWLEGVGLGPINNDLEQSDPILNELKKAKPDIHVIKSLLKNGYKVTNEHKERAGLLYKTFPEGYLTIVDTLNQIY